MALNVYSVLMQMYMVFGWFIHQQSGWEQSKGGFITMSQKSTQGEPLSLHFEHLL